MKKLLLVAALAVAGFAASRLYPEETNALLATASKTGSTWLERLQRVPLPVLKKPERAPLSLGGGSVERAKTPVVIVERRALPTDSPVVALVEREGVLVAGTFDEGLFRLPSCGDGGFEPQPLTVDHRVNDAAFAGDGTLFVATQGGAWRVSPDGAAERVGHGAFTAVAIWNGLPHFVSNRGLSRLEHDGMRTFGPQQGFGADRPMALAACGDRLCVGAMDGLWLFDGRSAERRSSASGDLPADWVVAAARSASSIWAATYDGGLARLEGSSARRFGGTDGMPELRVNPHALAFDGELLGAGTPSGLLAVRGETASLVSAGLPSPDVTALAPSACGGLWVGYRGGLLRVRFGAGEDA